MTSHHWGLTAAAACKVSPLHKKPHFGSGPCHVLQLARKVMKCFDAESTSESTRRNRVSSVHTNRTLARWQKESVGGGARGGCRQVRKQWDRRRKDRARQRGGRRRERKSLSHLEEVIQTTESQQQVPVKGKKYIYVFIFPPPTFIRTIVLLDFFF